MSRNPQSPKRVEAQPAPEAGAALAPPAMGATSPSADERQVTERVAPRRKHQKLNRDGEPSTTEAASDTAEEIEKLLASLGPSAVECTTAETFTSQVIVNDCLSDVGALEPSATESTLEFASPTSDAELLSPTETEIELKFKVAKPRRRAAKAPSATASPLPDEREVQVRTVVRGPRNPGLTRPSAWETTIRADLEEPRLVAQLAGMVDRWKADRGDLAQTSLFISSLGTPLAAAELAMRAGVMLAQRDDVSVLVVDGDPESALSRRLAITGKPGVNELLAPQDAHAEAIFATATPRLHVLPRGRGDWPAQANVASLGKMLGELAHEYAWILVCGGDAHSVPTQTFARACRGTYVVATLGETDLAVAQKNLAGLHAAGARVLGAIALDK